MDNQTVLIEIGLIILGLGLVARLAHRLSISPIPLYLLAGLEFGDGGIVQIAGAERFIEIGAQIGVVMLLFTLGLEYSASELTDQLKRNRVGGFIDLLANFTPGLLFGLLMHWGIIASVVLGGIIYVSSSGIAAKTLADLGRLANRETPTVLSILVMEDLAMAIFLPLVSSLVTSQSPRDIAVSVAIVILAVALKRGNWLGSFLKTQDNNEVLLLLILGITLTVAGLAEAVHVSAGVGAFVVGIALSDKIAPNTKELLHPLRDLFAAVFLSSLGCRQSLQPFLHRLFLHWLSPLLRLRQRCSRDSGQRAVRRLAPRVLYAQAWH